MCPYIVSVNNECIKNTHLAIGQFMVGSVCMHVIGIVGLDYFE